MADDKKEPWLNWLALTTVMLALFATLSTFKGGGYSTRAVLSQTQASDQWAFYQSKSIKGYLYEIQRDRLAVELKHGIAAADPKAAADYTKQMEDYSAKIAKYEKEKAEISQTAKKLEENRDEAQAHSKTFGMAVIYLQLAILLSSIAALLKKKPVWLAGLALGVVGAGYFISGFM